MSATFLTDEERRTLDAMTARIFPGDPEDPGAREAGVVDYIERSLSGYDAALQQLYRKGLEALDRACEQRFGSGFNALAEVDQVEMLAAMERLVPARDAAEGPADPAAVLLGRLFAMVREHTLEGMFSDPFYGGNRDMAGWRLIGFPGAQWGYAPEHKTPGFDARAIAPLSLDDLRRRRRGAA